nr:hypothetical protein CFP56_00167 [Quercus suber]
MKDVQELRPWSAFGRRDQSELIDGIVNEAAEKLCKCVLYLAQREHGTHGFASACAPLRFAAQWEASITSFHRQYALFILAAWSLVFPHQNGCKLSSSRQIPVFSGDIVSVGLDYGSRSPAFDHTGSYWSLHEGILVASSQMDVRRPATAPHTFQDGAERRSFCPMSQRLAQHNSSSVIARLARSITTT